MKPHKINNSPNRIILSEVLPYELPLPLDTHSLYRLLRRLKFEWIDGCSFKVLTRRLTKADQLWIELIFDGAKLQLASTAGHWSTFKTGNTKNNPRITHPFKYVTRRNNGKPRELSIIHPQSMLEIANFIVKSSDSILHYTNRSSFSIRYPSSVARLTQKGGVDTLTHKDSEDFNVEQHNLSYDYASSYFTYREYNQIHRFYSSPTFKDCERKYPTLLKMDVAKCFDSMYTHTMSWVTNGWSPSKELVSRRSTIDTFGGRFDTHLQSLNYGETSGIVIGPEFSRVFAEIIMQEVDINIERRITEKLGLTHKEDYEIFRYVDDYFVFLSDDRYGNQIYDIVESQLSHFKLHLNDRKTETLQTPLRSHISVAKHRIRKDIKRLSICRINSGDATKNTLRLSSDKARMEYKSTILDADLDHGEIANYYLYFLEKTAKQLCSKFTKHIETLEATGNTAEARRALDNLTTYLLSVIDIALSIYAGAPSASHSIKLTRIVVMAVDLLGSTNVPYMNMTGFKNKVTQDLRRQLTSSRERKGIDLHTLNLIDCLTYLDANMNSHELHTVIQQCATSVDQLDTLSILILIRHCGARTDAASFLDQLLGRVKSLVETQSRKLETEHAILKISLAGCPHLTVDQIQNATGLSKAKIRILKKSQISLLFDWSVSDYYYQRLLLKETRAVY